MPRQTGSIGRFGRIIVSVGVVATVAVAGRAGADNKPAPPASDRPFPPRQSVLSPNEGEMTLHRNGKTYVVKYKTERKIERQANGELVEVISGNVDDVMAGLPADVRAEIQAENEAARAAKGPR